jgi:hypothetical protein
MSDTLLRVSELVAERHAQMGAAGRMRAASAMYDVAIAIVDSSLPQHLSRRERRLARAQRIYGDELPQAALEAYADYGADGA